MGDRSGLPWYLKYYVQYFHGKQKHKQAKQWEKGASLKGRFAPWADAVQDFGWNFGFKEHRVASKRYHEPWNYGMIVDFDNTPRNGIKAAALGGKFRGGPRHLAAGLDTLMAATVSSAEVTLDIVGICALNKGAPLY